MAGGVIRTWFSGSLIVSPMVMPSMPARQTMSPAAACSISTRFRPSKANNLVIFVNSIDPPSFSTDTGPFSFTVPLNTRPIAIRPR